MCLPAGIGSIGNSAKTPIVTATPPNKKTNSTMALPGLNNGGPQGGDVVKGNLPAPVTTPVTTPAPAEVINAQNVTGRSRKKTPMDIMRSGLLSTLKTGTSGVSGLPWLATPAAGDSELKTKLGQ
jgi:hypothetical protein